MQEVNYTNEQDQADIQIPGYSWEFDQLFQLHGRSRAALLISNDLRYVRRQDLEANSIAHVWITINLQGAKKINLQTYYRQWQLMGVKSRIPETNSVNSQNERLKAVAVKWRQAMNEGETHSFSDTNLNLRNLGKLPTELNFHDRKLYPLQLTLQTLILNEGAGVIITNDTRYNPQSRITEFIDHCITNRPEKINNQTIHRTGDSDHFIGQFQIKTRTKPCTPRFILSRKWELVNWDLMKVKLHDDPDLKEISNLTDPNQICCTLQDKINLYLDQQAPTRKLQLSNKVPKFSTSETRKLIKLRDVTLEKAKQTQDIEDWRQFRNLKNRVHRELSNDKKNFTNKQLEDENSAKDKWKTTKTLLGWEKAPQPKIIIDQGVAKTKPVDIANAMNMNFLTKVNKIVRNIPKTDVDPCHNFKKLMINKSCKFQLRSIDMKELRKTIIESKSSHSAGMDTISMRVVKNVLREIEEPLLKLVNQSIITQTYPSTLKTAKTIPVYKHATPPKPPAEPNSYRGINIINTIGKIIDKVVLKQTLEYLVSNDLILESHHGALRGKSTITAIATVIDTWTTKIENNEEIAAIAMDQSAAYDLIDHPILIKKMIILGFQPDTIKWFVSYLADRQQQVQIDGAKSQKLHIGNKSVIQGSVLSCILYLLYILDLPTIFHEQTHTVEQTDECRKPSLQTFVDDILTTIHREEKKSMQESIVSSIDIIETYMQANRLSLNRDKTQLILLGKPNSPKSHVSIPAHPAPIEPKPTLKFLGVTIHESLHWKSFLTDGNENLYSQLKKRLSAIKKLRSSMSFKFAKNFATAIFIGKLNYAAELWGGAPAYLRNKIQTLQLEAARMVIGPVSFRWSRFKLLQKMNWMSVEDTLAFTANKLTYRIFHTGKPELLHHRLMKVRPTNINNTRLSGPYKIGPRPTSVGRTNMTKNQYRSKSYEFYAKIPHEIQKLSKFSHFTKWLKKNYKYGATEPSDYLPKFDDQKTRKND